MLTSLSESKRTDLLTCPIFRYTYFGLSLCGKRKNKGCAEAQTLSAEYYIVSGVVVCAASDQQTVALHNAQLGKRGVIASWPAVIALAELAIAFVLFADTIDRCHAIYCEIHRRAYR